MLIQNENRNKRDTVKNEEAKIKANLDNFKVSRENLSKGVHEGKLEIETKRVSHAERILKELEYKE